MDLLFPMSVPFLQGKELADAGMNLSARTAYDPMDRILALKSEFLLTAM